METILSPSCVVKADSWQMEQEVCSSILPYICLCLCLPMTARQHAFVEIAGDRWRFWRSSSGNSQNHIPDLPSFLVALHLLGHLRVDFHLFLFVFSCFALGGSPGSFNKPHPNSTIWLIPSLPFGSNFWLVHHYTDICKSGGFTQALHIHTPTSYRQAHLLEAMRAKQQSPASTRATMTRLTVGVT